jgi:hypothetical protein
MTLSILDTDHISLFLGNYSPVRNRVIQTKADCSITIISVQEIFNGWVGQLNRVENETYKIEIYQRLHLTAQFIQQMSTFEFGNNLDTDAIHQFLKHFLGDVTLISKHSTKQMLEQIWDRFAVVHIPRRNLKVK